MKNGYIYVCVYVQGEKYSCVFVCRSVGVSDN